MGEQLRSEFFHFTHPLHQRCRFHLMGTGIRWDIPIAKGSSQRLFVLDTAEVVKPLNEIILETFRDSATSFALTNIGINHTTTVRPRMPPKTRRRAILYVRLALPLGIANESFSWHYL